MIFCICSCLKCGFACYQNVDGAVGMDEVGLVECCVNYMDKRAYSWSPGNNWKTHELWEPFSPWLQLLFARPCSFSLCVCLSVQQGLWGLICTLELFFCVAPHLSYSFQLSQPPWTPICLLNSAKLLCLWSPVLLCSPCRSHGPVLPVVHCLKNRCFEYFVSFLVVWLKLNSFPVTLLMPRSRSSHYF